MEHSLHAQFRLQGVRGAWCTSCQGARGFLGLPLIQIHALFCSSQNIVNPGANSLELESRSGLSSIK